MIERIQTEFHRQQAETPDLYAFLNDFRAWFNQHVANYELFLEDNWFAEKTTLEYTLRSLDTLNQLILAEDEYQNHIAQGTWHLGPYVTTYWTVEDPWGHIAHFLAENPAPQEKPAH